jgi:hypothetical protein
MEYSDAITIVRNEIRFVKEMEQWSFERYVENRTKNKKLSKSYWESYNNWVSKVVALETVLEKLEENS